MRFVRNLVHLFIWQGSTFLVPLFVTPYLARVLGLNAFGVFGVSLAVISYFVLLCDWGFSLSATQKVARAADSPAELRIIFWNTIFARIILASVALGVLVILIVSVPALRAIWAPLLGASVSIVATSMSASWFLQGLRMMGSFAAASLFGKLLTVPFMVLFVHEPGDVARAALIQASAQLVSDTASLVVATRAVQLGRPSFSFSGAIGEIRDGWQQFVSNLAVSFYTQANTVFVGLLSGSTQAGLLAGSQRISQAFQGLVVPINLAVYPLVNRLTVEDPPAAVRVMFRVLKGQAAFALCLSLTMFFIAPWAVPVFLGEEFRPAIEVVQVMSMLPFLVGVTNVLGTNILLPLGQASAYTTTLVVAGIFNVGLLLVLTPRLGALGGAISAVGTETLLVVMMAVVIRRRRDILDRMRNETVPS